MTTDSTGHADTGNAQMYVGAKYTLTETKAAEGYAINSDSKTFECKCTGNSVSYSKLNIDVGNDSQKGKLALEQPVNCGRLAPCTLGEALGRASGRRGQQRLDLHLIIERQNAGHDRRLARARPTRHDQQLPLCRHPDGLALLRGIGQRLALLGPIHQRIQIRWGFHWSFERC